MNQTNICSICAWRETCQKKFKLSGKDLRCADFTKDISIGKKETKSASEKETKEKKK